MNNNYNNKQLLCYPNFCLDETKRKQYAGFDINKKWKEKEKQSWWKQEEKIE
jgi:hypothetical protein